MINQKAHRLTLFPVLFFLFLLTFSIVNVKAETITIRFNQYTDDYLLDNIDCPKTNPGLTLIEDLYFNKTNYIDGILTGCVLSSSANGKLENSTIETRSGHFNLGGSGGNAFERFVFYFEQSFIADNNTIIKTTGKKGDIGFVNYLCYWNELGNLIGCAGTNCGISGMYKPCCHEGDLTTSLNIVKYNFSQLVNNEYQCGDMIKNLSEQKIRYVSVDLAGAATGDDIYLHNISIENIYYTDNSFPIISINNQKSVYCYNDSSNIYIFPITATDAEGDEIYYYDYWNDDYDSDVLIDDFNNPSYSMSSNGWAFNTTGCTYSTAENYLELYSSCQNVSMVKWLSASELSGEDLTVSFQAWVFRNTTNDYDLWNWHNEKLTGIKLATFYDPVYNALYTNFSYWDGNQYVFFNQSYYVGLFVIDIELSGNTVHYCISGLDEPSYTGCNYEVTTALHGITDNIPAKFYMAPTYNFGWEEYEPSYVVLDELKYIWTEIPWKTYSNGDSISHIFNTEGQQELNILVTDNVHSPDYITYGFPITVQGDCKSIIYFNETQINGSILNITQNYLDAIDDGYAKFNTLFWIMLFLVFLFVIISVQTLSISLIATGSIGFITSWLLTGDLVQMVSSIALIGFGITILITGTF